MKYLFTAALALACFATALAQQAPALKVVRAVRTATGNHTSHLQTVMDKLQQESEKTVVYPLVRMTNLALAKVESLKKEMKRTRIRSHNSKRVANPNRA